MRIIFAIALLVLSGTASAKTIVCNTCGDYRASAKAAGEGVHYIVNNLNGTVKKYRVNWMRGSGLTPIEMQVESQIVNYANFVKQNKQPQVQLDNRGDFPQSAYEFVEFPHLRNRVGAWIKEGGWGLVQDYATFLGAVGSIVGFDANALDITIRIIMADGSTALYVYNHTTQTWVPVEDQTRDSSNNVVPETLEDVSGGAGQTTIYEFNNSEDLIQFIQRMSMLGVEISGPVGNLGQPMVCITDPETGKTICHPG